LILKKIYIERLISLILITGIFTLLYNDVINLHTHLTLDGRMISHSHPFNDEDAPGSQAKHNHTTAQFVNFDKLNHQVTVQQKKMLCLITVLTIFTSFLCTNENDQSNSERYRINRLRAPPLI